MKTGLCKDYDALKHKVDTELKQDFTGMCVLGRKRNEYSLTRIERTNTFRCSFNSTWWFSLRLPYVTYVNVKMHINIVKDENKASWRYELPDKCYSYEILDFKERSE